MTRKLHGLPAIRIPVTCRGVRGTFVNVPGEVPWVEHAAGNCTSPNQFLRGTGVIGNNWKLALRTPDGKTIQKWIKKLAKDPETPVPFAEKVTRDPPPPEVLPPGDEDEDGTDVFRIREKLRDLARVYASSL